MGTRICTNAHAQMLSDPKVGGHPPGSDAARLAIQTVGIALYGKDWKPGRHRGHLMESISRAERRRIARERQDVTA